MSDLAATNCGCDNGCDNNSGLFNFGGGSCNCIIWLILLSTICGGNGCGNGYNGFGDNSCLIILLLLFCCGGNGCGC